MSQVLDIFEIIFAAFDQLFFYQRNVGPLIFLGLIVTSVLIWRLVKSCFNI